MIDTGGTLMSAVNHLIRQGASEVLAAATHAVFSGDAIQRIQALVDVGFQYFLFGIADEETLTRLSQQVIPAIVA